MKKPSDTPTRSSGDNITVLITVLLFATAVFAKMFIL